MGGTAPQGCAKAAVALGGGGCRAGLQPGDPPPPHGGPGPTAGHGNGAGGGGGSAQALPGSSFSVTVRLNTSWGEARGEALSPAAPPRGGLRGGPTGLSPRGSPSPPCCRGPQRSSPGARTGICQRGERRGRICRPGRCPPRAGRPGGGGGQGWHGTPGPPAPIPAASGAREAGGGGAGNGVPPHGAVSPAPAALTGLRSLRKPPGTSAGSSGFLCKNLKKGQIPPAPGCPRAVPLGRGTKPCQKGCEGGNAEPGGAERC